MAYKDKDRQREAVKEATKRYRASKQGITTSKDNKDPVIPCNALNVIPDVIPEQGTLTPEGIKAQVPANYGQPDCECRHCQNNRVGGSRYILNHGKYKTFEELNSNELNRVSSPGDIDYTPAKPKTDKPKAKASGPNVQAVWDRRNAQGQDCFDGLPVRQLREAK